MKKLILIASILLTVVASANAQALTKQERALWNGFVNHLDSLELRGSVKLDTHTTSVKLFNEYTENTIDYTSFVIRVQTEIAAYRAKALEQIKTGKAVFNGTEAEFMAGLSVVDGWAGSKTTNYKFPSDTVKVFATNYTYSKANNVYNN